MTIGVQRSFMLMTKTRLCNGKDQLQVSLSLYIYTASVKYLGILKSLVRGRQTKRISLTPITHRSVCLYSTQRSKNTELFYLPHKYQLEKALK